MICFDKFNSSFFLLSKCTCHSALGRLINDNGKVYLSHTFKIILCFTMELKNLPQNRRRIYLHKPSFFEVVLLFMPPAANNLFTTIKYILRWSIRVICALLRLYEASVNGYLWGRRTDAGGPGGGGPWRGPTLECLRNRVFQQQQKRQHWLG